MVGNGVRARRPGKVLLVANPAAQSGAGREAAQVAAAELGRLLGPGLLDLVYTEAPGHAEQLAARTDGCAAVVALGGDGVIGEVANGLMARGAGERPALGVLPVGSGNDYARALGVSTDVRTACEQFVHAVEKPVDLGRVNGRYFVETLSFGMDAAIALQTMELRASTGRTGTALYMRAGFDQLLHHRDVCAYEAVFDGAAPERGSSLTFAVQVGPYYGGGFKICPGAALDDGFLDVCVAHPPLGLVGAARLFLRAKNGRHVGSPAIELRRVRSLWLSFGCEPPAQADGERLTSSTFDIQVVTRALGVLVPKI
jgi:YegS/Rv2252/BmrU family lipid kinase